jgi:cytochrome c oxidase subunit IV
VRFPLPWSRASETSFLVTSDAMKSALEQTGFKVVAWDRVAILQAVLVRPLLIIKSVRRT